MRSREREFSELDAASGGDGDHGTAIVAALDAMVSAVGADFKESLERMAETLEERVSGSTASLYGSWLEGMAGAVGEGVQELDEEGLAALFEGGLEEVEAATGARVGDKTLMDALIPATVAFSKAAGAASDGGDLGCFGGDLRSVFLEVLVMADGDGFIEASDKGVGIGVSRRGVGGRFV